MSNFRLNEMAVEFSDTYGNHINCGRLHAPNTAYDNDFWFMAKVKPEAGNSAGRYFFTTSRSGNHVLMVGFTAGNTSGYLKLIAYHNANNQSVLSDLEFKAGIWHEFAIGLRGCTTTNDGTFYAFIDGVPVGSKAKTTSRHGNDNEQTLFVGGNEHSTLIGRIAQVALYEGATCFPQLNGDELYIPFPEFRTRYEGSAGTVAASFLMDLSKGSLADLSDGFNGGVHSGQFDNGADSGAFMRDLTNFAARTVNTPSWVIDRVILSAHDGTAIPSQETDAIHQDSFTRENATLEPGRTMGLGACEYGGQTWSDGGFWGILENNAYPNAAGGTERIATIDAGQTSYSIKIEPSAVNTGGATANIIFRYQDSTHYYRLLLNGGDGTIYLYRNNGAGETNVSTSGTTPVTAGWTSAKMTLDGSGNLSVRMNGGGSSVFDVSTLPSFAAATKVGMASHSTLRKVKKFVVYSS